MMLYSAAGFAPNPRRVKIFLAEKGLSVPVTELSLFTGEQKAPAFLAKNGRGQVPALELDDGTVIAESIAICRYFEVLHPEPPLFGTGALGIATTEMWLRRVEMALMPPLAAVWGHTHPLTAKIVQQNRDWGESNRPRVLDTMRWFDAALGERPYLAGDHYSIADIALQTTVDFAAFIEMPVPADCPTLQAWFDRVHARPSASA